MTTPRQNPCVFKECCRSCNKAGVEERPQMCVTLNCPEFIPCPNCQQNRTLHDLLSADGIATGKRWCKFCIADSRKNVARQTREAIKSLAATSSASTGNPASPVPGPPVTGTRDFSKVFMTLPGTPPSALEDHEKDYYTARWKEYDGYYRNPSAYFNVHQLILFEIHCTYLNAQLIHSRGELLSALSRDLQVATRLRKEVSDQLPEREAEDVMDDEKAMSRIYEKYREEKKARSLGVVSRIFRQDTLALAPALEFKIDPRDLLERAGFTVVDADRILPRIKDFTEKGKKTPEEILKFFGFVLDEEYAMANAPPDIEDFNPEDELYQDLDLKEEL